MPAWPNTLPNPSVEGYSIDTIDQTVRTDFEFGAQRVRRRSAARLDRVKLAWKFTDAEMATFRTWFDSATDAAGGSAWFSVSLPVGETGLDTKDARFVGPWQATSLPGLLWSVSAELEVR